MIERRLVGDGIRIASMIHVETGACAESSVSGRSRARGLRPVKACAQRIALLVLVGSPLSGCSNGSTTPDKAQIDEVDRRAAARIGQEFSAGLLLGGGTARGEPAPTGPLTRGQAVSIALKGNLSLVASAETLAVAQAQLVQAGLLQNPVIGQSSGLLFPVSPVQGRASFDVNISQQVNTLLTRPSKVAIAEVQRTQAGIDLANQAFTLAMQVQSKYDELVHSRRSEVVAQRVSDLYARAATAAEARSKVGIVPQPEVNRASLAAADAARQQRHLHLQVDRAMRELNWLMGFRGAPQWTLPEELIAGHPALAEIPEEEGLLALGLRYRLDFERSGFDMQLSEANVKLAKANKFPQLSLGLESAFDNAGNLVLGPFFSVALPIFDTGQTGVDLARAQQRQVEKVHAALAGQVLQDVRTALSNVQIAEEDVVFYRDRILPQQEQNVNLAQQAFSLGLSDLDSLLNILQGHATALQSYEDAIGTHRAGIVSLQQATGLVVEMMTREVIDDALREESEQIQDEPPPPMTEEPIPKRFDAQRE